MILGLPIDAWLLLVVAVGLGLALELAFHRARRHDRGVGDAPPGARSEDRAGRGDA